MQAHANDLRAEVERDWDTLSTTPRPADAGLDAFVHQVVADWRQAPLNNAVRRLVEYAEKLTRAPATCAAADIADLRAAGWCDASIHDAVQVIAYFAYINRITDGLGVEDEQGLPRWGSAPV